MKLKAVGHRLIVEPDPVETVTEGGIILKIDTKQERAGSQKGTVLQVGPMAWKNEFMGFGVEGWAPWVQPGDRVFFARYAGKMVKASDDPKDEKYYVVLNDEDIQALIEED
jgi:co-chaperonin GroES (HSP10)